jgi:hypothetical protein
MKIEELCLFDQLVFKTLVQADHGSMPVTRLDSKLGSGKDSTSVRMRIGLSENAN